MIDISHGMEKDMRKGEAVENQEFPLSCREFCQEIAKPESRAAFYALMKSEAAKSRADWQRLYALFQRRPVSIPWPEWIAKGGK